jgi:hypothetical protein
MRHVKKYNELFEAQMELTPEQIKWLDKCTKGKWTLNKKTGLVDVRGDFICSGQGLTDFKGVRFGAVTKIFNCHRNSLTSLEGAPQKAGLAFDCSDNQLTSLEGAPQEVGRDLYFLWGNPVSQGTLRDIYKKMNSGMSWPDAVESYWDEIGNEEDKILLSPHHPDPSREEIKGYQALAKFRNKII